ncbi:MAG: RICIN domain-containing protein [Coriobacteriales bacterium]|jgi:uncharacterized protein YjdB|nr:RICIN domain-containing protein [Coriobacteriales bacterium]
MKKIVSVFLAAALTFALVPFSVGWADEVPLEAGDAEQTADAVSIETPNAEAPTLEAPILEVPNTEAPTFELGLQSEKSQSNYLTLAEAQAANAVAGVPDDPRAYIEGEILVVLAGQDFEAKELSAVEESISALSGTRTSVKTTVIDSAPNGDSTVHIELPTGVTVKEALLLMANDANVVFAQPNFIYALPKDEVIGGSIDFAASEAASSDLDPLYMPNDPFFWTVNAYYQAQWWLRNVGAFGAWDLQRANKAVTVAVVDSGIRMTHKDLAGNIIKNLAWDAYNNKPLTTDISGHGTHVAGIVAAEAGNAYAGAGISYNAKILPINIFFEVSEGRTSASTTTLVAAYTYIMAHRQEANIRVVNLSLGGPNDDPAVHNAIIKADKAGILTVCAAGNDGTDVNINVDNAPSYPSDYAECVSVVSVDKSNNRSTYSEHNAYKDIAAPGTEILSTYYSSDESYVYMQGTSMASPVVAGVAALLFAKNPKLTCNQAKKALYDTATDGGTPGWDKYWGWGLVNAQKAVEALPTPVTGVTLNAKTKSVAEGKSFTLTATVAPTNATNKAVTWKSSNTAVAKVSSSGKVTGVKAGKATITVTTKDGSKTASCTVTVTPVAVTGVTLNAKTKTLVAGTAFTLAATVAPSNASNKAVTWASSNTAIAKVSSAGKVTAVKPGSAKITVTTKDGSKTASCTVTVTPVKVTGVTLNAATKSLEVGLAFTLTATVAPTNATNKALTWTSSNLSVATVDPFGKVSAVKVGTATITVTTKDGAKKAVCTVTVKAQLIPNGTYIIRTSDALSKTKAIDIQGASTANGAKVQIWESNNTSAQRFSFTRGTDGYYTIKNINSGKVLDVAGGVATPGCVINQYAPNGTNAQKWRATKNSDGSFTLSSRLNTNLCLDIQGGSSANGAVIQLYTKNSSAAQRFKLTSLAPALATGTYTIGASYTNMVLDVSGASTANGANIHLWAPNKTNAQKFKLTYSTATGYYAITNVGSKAVLDVNGASAANGANVQQWVSNSTFAQRWMIEKVGSNYRVIAAHSGLVLDAAGAGKANGTNVQTWAANGSAAQVWKFTKVG